MFIEVIRLVGARKARAAFLAPLVLAVGAALANFIVTGTIDTTEIQLAAAGAISGLAAAGAAWLAPAGVAQVEPTVELIDAVLEAASNLDPKAAAEILGEDRAPTVPPGLGEQA